MGKLTFVCVLYREVISIVSSSQRVLPLYTMIILIISITVQDSAGQDYLEVVKIGSDKHTYNIFQSNNNIRGIVVVRAGR